MRLGATMTGTEPGWGWERIDADISPGADLRVVPEWVPSIRDAYGRFQEWGRS